jgi:CelD/BcsL family acetyltransferase involved in cellulose biosynthesis
MGYTTGVAHDATTPSNVRSSETVASRAWLDLLRRRYGYEDTTLTTVDADQQVSGTLPLCTVNSPLTGRRLVSLPFTDVCPLLTVDEASAHQLLDRAVTLAQARHVRYLELRTGSNAVLAARDDFAASNLYVRSAVPLTRETETLFAELRKSVRQQVRKAQRCGVTVRFAQTRDDIALYHRLHLRTRSRKHGMPAQSRRFFLDLWDTFAPAGMLHLLLAAYEGQPIAGMILVGEGDTIRYAYGASDERALHLAPNHLLLWAALCWAGKRGFSSLDMGRTALANAGLIEFKRGWGALEEPLPYYYYPQVAGLAATSEQSKTYHLLTACWKRLPLAVAAPLGAALYKHLG